MHPIRPELLTISFYGHVLPERCGFDIFFVWNALFRSLLSFICFCCMSDLLGGCLDVLQQWRMWTFHVGFSGT